MPRTIEVVVRTDLTQPFLERIGAVAGVLAVVVHRGAALDPPGDEVVIRATNEGTRDVLRAIDAVLPDDCTSFTTQQPQSLFAPGFDRHTGEESDETIWEEMDSFLRQESSNNANFLLLMLAAGLLAGAGLWSDQFFLIIAAQIIAPGFEPILRLPFGAVAGMPRAALLALRATVCGYAVLAAGGAAAFLIGYWLDPGTVSDLSGRQWVGYWSEIGPMNTAVACIAGVAGAAIVSAQKGLLSAGVQVALAVIPAMALAGMALAAGKADLALAALARWAVDVACIVLAGGATLWLKRRLIHRRDSRS